jgi:hypothetical protein
MMTFQWMARFSRQADGFFLPSHFTPPSPAVCLACLIPGPCSSLSPFHSSLADEMIDRCLMFPASNFTPLQCHGQQETSNKRTEKRTENWAIKIEASYGLCHQVKFRPGVKFRPRPQYTYILYIDIGGGHDNYIEIYCTRTHTLLSLHI